MTTYRAKPPTVDAVQVVDADLDDEQPRPELVELLTPSHFCEPDEVDIVGPEPDNEVEHVRVLAVDGGGMRQHARAGDWIVRELRFGSVGVITDAEFTNGFEVDDAGD